MRSLISLVIVLQMDKDNYIFLKFIMKAYKDKNKEYNFGYVLSAWT